MTIVVPPMVQATAPAPLRDEDYRALGEFRAAMRRFLAFSEAGARAHGLTAQQHQALLAIRSHDGSSAVSVGDLARTLLIRNHSAVGLVERLVERGLVSRRPDAGDRRKVLVELLPPGLEALDAISRRNLEQLGQAADILAGIVETARRQLAK